MGPVELLQSPEVHVEAPALDSHGSLSFLNFTSPSPDQPLYLEQEVSLEALSRGTSQPAFASFEFQIDQTRGFEGAYIPLDLSSPASEIAGEIKEWVTAFSVEPIESGFLIKLRFKVPATYNWTHQIRFQKLTVLNINLEVYELDLSKITFKVRGVQ